MALDYRQVSDLYRTLRDSGATTLDLPEWSQQMNALSGTDLYTAGINDNWIKRASVGIDRTLEATGAPQASESFGRSVGELIDAGDTGASIGHGLPRMAVDFLPFTLGAAATALTGGTAAIPIAAALGSGVLSGAGAYTATDSPAAGLFAGATNALMPSVANLAGRYALRAAGVPLTEGLITRGLTEAGEPITRSFSQYIPTTLTHTAIDQAAQQLGGSAFGEVSRAVQAGLDPNSEYSLDPKEILLEMTLGQLPFTATHIAGKVFHPGPSGAEAKANIEENIARTKEYTEARDSRPETSDYSRVANYSGAQDENSVIRRDAFLRKYDPDYREVTPEDYDADLTNQIELANKELASIGVDQELSPEDRVARYDELNETLATLREKQKVSDSLVTPVPGASDARTPITGTDTKFSGSGRSVTFTVGDTPENVTAGFTPGERVRYSLPENAPKPQGDTHFVPSEQYHTKGVPDRYAQARAEVIADPQTQFELEGSANDPAGTERILDTKTRERSRELARTEASQLAKDLYDAPDEVSATTAYRALQEFVDTNDVPISLRREAEKYFTQEVPKLSAKEVMQAVASDVVATHRAQTMREARVEEAAREREDATQWVGDSNNGVNPQDLTDLQALERELATRGTNAQAMSTSGELNRLFRAWVEGGRIALPGDEGDPFNTFRQQVLARAPQGRGVPRNRKERIPLTTETEPVKESLYEHANAVAESFTDTGQATELRDAIRNGADGEIVEILRELGELPQKRRAYAKPNLSAGSGWVWGLGNYDPITNKLNGKPHVRKDGTMSVATFKDVAGVGKPLADGEIALARELVPEAFDGDSVNVKELYRLLPERAPVLEEKKLGEGDRSAQQQRIAELEHQLDTVEPNWRSAVGEDREKWPVETSALFDELNRVQFDADEEANVGGARYFFLGPKSEQEMPGYVEGLVKLPGKVKFTHDHFSNDPNVVAFYRGYEEVVNGEKVFHLIEVQSDWAQQQRKFEKDARETTGLAQERFTAATKQSSPLLRVYETLALKSAIKHAKEIGAKRIVLSDAETAMMTEGHDNIANIQYAYPAPPDTWQGTNKEWMEQQNLRPPQEAGMRLHYDQTLPSALKKLTGDSGERVELGTHKTAQVAEDDVADGRAVNESNVSGSPVFRNPDGTPKSSITGRSYDLARAFQTINEQGGSTLFDPARSKPTQFVPVTKSDEDYIATLSTGSDLVSFVESAGDEGSRELGRILRETSPRALANIVIEHIDDDVSHVVTGPNGQTIVRLSADLRKASHEVQQAEITEELWHAVTLQALEDPRNAKQFDELTALRQRVIEALPKALRNKLNKAIVDNWYDNRDSRFTQDEIDLVYGLFDNRELLANVTSPCLRNFLASQKSTGKRTFWNDFTDWVKKTIGWNAGDTALDEVLSYNSIFRQKQEELLAFHDYGQRLLEKQGVRPEIARVQTDRAAGILKGSAQGISTEQVIDHLLLDTQSVNADVLRAKSELTRLFSEDVPTREKFGSMLSELGLDATSDGALELENHLFNSNITQTKLVMELVPEAMRNLLFATARDTKQVLDVVAGATSKNVEPWLNLETKKALTQPISAARKAVTKILSYESAHERAIREFQLALGLAPDVAATQQFSPAYAKPKINKLDPKLDAFAKGFAPQWQLARREKSFAPVVAAGMQLGADARMMFMKAGHVLGVDLTTGDVTKSSIKQLFQFRKNTKLKRAVNELMWLNNREGGNAVGQLSDSHPERARILSGLSAEERSAVREKLAQSEVANATMNREVLGSLREEATWRATPILASMKPEDAKAVASELFDIVNSDWTDQTSAASRYAEMQALAQKVSPEEFPDLVRHVEASVAQWKTYQDKAEANPAWASARRYGSFEFNFLENGKPVYLRADSWKEAKRLSGGKPLLNFREAQDFDERMSFGTETQAMLDRLRELQKTKHEILRRRGVPEDVIALDAQYGEVGQLATEATYAGGLTDVVSNNRTLGKGSEKLDWFANQITYFNNLSAYRARQVYKAKLASLLRSPELQARPDLLEAAKLSGANLLSRDPAAATNVRRLLTYWILSGSPASALANGTQMLLRGVSELTSITNKPVDSYRRVLSTYRQMLNGKWDDSRVGEMLKRAVREGHAGASQFDENELNNVLNPINLKRMTNGGEEQSLGQMLSSPVGSVFSAGMGLFRMMEKSNVTAALVTRFHLGLDEGLSTEDAYREAVAFNGVVNDVGGKANRPLGLFSGKDDFSKSAALLGTSMQSYVLGSTAQMITYLKQGFFRSSGLAPHEVWGARKAATQMLATQFALAGALGLPFASGALALLNSAFPSLEINKNIRQWLAQLLDDDDDPTNGNILGDLALSGAPSMLGWDWQSRLSAGQIPGVSELNGFQPAAIAGPLASVLGSFVRGSSKLLGGDASGVVDLMPPALKKITDLALGGGTIRDYRNRPLFDPTPGESLGIALGFNPKRLSDFNAAGRMAQQGEEVASARESQFRNGLAEQVLQGNIGTVRARLRERVEADPNFDPANAVRTIARTAEDLIFPRDLRREGTSAARSRLLSSFNISPSAPTESLRLQFRQSVEQSLGVAPARTQEFRVAGLMDQLRLEHPGATRLELRQLAESSMRPQRQNSLALLE